MTGAMALGANSSSCPCFGISAEMKCSLKARKSSAYKNFVGMRKLKSMHSNLSSSFLDDECFIAENDPADGKVFLRNLAKEFQDLAERVMITRLHLYGKWIKQCDHAEIYKEISDENLELMRERLMETIVWPTDEKNTE
ncbi:chaperonin-like RbcX protein 2, chloroplastic [Tanacetum coccineum]